MVKYALYAVVNVVFFFVTLWLLLYLSTYINLRFIPHVLISALANILITLVEALLITWLIYLLNKLILRYDYQTTKAKTIALRTALLTYGIILCIIVYGTIYTLLNS